MRNDVSQEEFGEFCHDLKNPLTVMKMNLELAVMDGEKNQKLQNLVKSIDKEITKILKIISDKSKQESKQEGKQG